MKTDFPLPPPAPVRLCIARSLASQSPRLGGELHSENNNLWETQWWGHRVVLGLRATEKESVWKVSR